MLELLERAGLPLTAGVEQADALEVAAERLLALDRLEERLEVAVAEAARAVALDHLEEQRRPVLRGLREDLQQVAVVVAVGEDLVPAQVVVDSAISPTRSGTSS